MKKLARITVVAAMLVVFLAPYAVSADRNITGEQAVLPFDVPMDRYGTKGLSTTRYTMSKDQRTNQELAVLTSFAVIDYTQSVAMFYRSNGYYELNPILGEKPSRRSMALFGMIGIGVFYALAKTLPDPWKQVFVDSILASEQMNIEDNRRIHQGWNTGGPPIRGRSFNCMPIILTFRF